LEFGWWKGESAWYSRKPKQHGDARDIPLVFALEILDVVIDKIDKSSGLQIPPSIVKRGFSTKIKVAAVRDLVETVCEL